MESADAKMSSENSVNTRGKGQVDLIIHTNVMSSPFIVACAEIASQITECKLSTPGVLCEFIQ